MAQESRTHDLKEAYEVPETMLAAVFEREGAQTLRINLLVEIEHRVAVQQE